MAELAELDDAIAIEFSKAALTIQENYGKADLIGSHGQTVYHRPPKERESRSRERIKKQREFGRKLTINQHLQLKILLVIAFN